MSIGDFSTSEGALSEQRVKGQIGKVPRSRQAVAKPDAAIVPEAR